jgi:Mrp family chromosome partitioning ATPase
MATLEQAQAALAQVMDPELNRNIVELGMVHDLALSDGVVSFTLALTTIKCPLRAQMQDDARTRLLALEGVCDVEISLREMTAAEKQAIFGQPQQEEKIHASFFNEIKQIIAIVSGKGGVGKSTTAALLALTLRRMGHEVGLLDADITGPSIPKMLLQNPPRPVGGPVGIMPVTTASGIKVMSINLLLDDPNKAVIWRGPLISGAIKQFYEDVHWGKLDYLIVDLPPGTSDATLTVMQSIPLNGVVLVTTPQSLAGMVVKKAASMAGQLDIPILGIIENMSYAVCPDCGKSFEVFGPSNSAAMAAELGAPLLGRLPLRPELATLADQGELESYAADEFKPLVEQLIALTNQA